MRIMNYVVYFYDSVVYSHLIYWHHFYFLSQSLHVNTLDHSESMNHSDHVVLKCLKATCFIWHFKMICFCNFYHSTYLEFDPEFQSRSKIRQSKINSRSVAGPIGQTNCRPSVWCSKYYFFWTFYRLRAPKTLHFYFCTFLKK